jgi:hypothetical protein
MTTAIRAVTSNHRRPSGGRVSARTLATLLLLAAAAALFLAYLRLSWTVAATGDGAANALQAQDMLRGNWLLHGWTVSDVSLYTTELPEYALVELAGRLGPGVIHVAAAVTYTLLVLLAGLLARGRARGGEGLARGLVAAGIMLAPQLGYGAFVLLLSPDHTGTQVPLLLGWLVLDLAPRRWWVPVFLGVLLAWTQVADRAALVTAVVPLVVVCLALACRTWARAGWSVPTGEPGWSVPTGEHGSPGRSRWHVLWNERWFELSLAAAAVASAGAARMADTLLARAGGFTASPLPLTLAPLRSLPVHLAITGESILELFGANFLGVSGALPMFFAVVHLVGLTLAAGGTALALFSCWQRPAGLSRWQRPAGRQIWRAGDLVTGVLAVAIVANLISYACSTTPGVVFGTGYEAREIAAILPLGAVLAGRLIGPKLAGREAPRLRSEYSAFPLAETSRALCFSIVLLCYGAALGYGAAQPAVPGQDADLAGWLTAHHLSYGLAGPEANIVTVDSGGRVRLAVVSDRGGQVDARLFQTQASWYDPRLHFANFLVTSTPPGSVAYAADLIAAADARRTFGPPARSYQFRGYTVMVWNVNLLTRLG